MKPIFYLASVLILFNSHTEGQRIDMVINNGEYVTDDVIDMNHVDFETFLAKRKIFVDKTLFLHMTMSRWKAFNSILLNFPPKWSKTTNLKMLQYFLEHSLDKNRQKLPQNQTICYKWVTEGKIIKDNVTLVNFDKIPVIGKHMFFVNDYIGKYPVVFLPFRQLQGDNHREFMHSFKELLADTFHQFSYLVDGKLLKVSEAEVNKFNNIKNQKENDEDVLAGSLRFLCELLNSTFHEQVVVLIDDCDVFINTTYHDDNYPDKEKSSKFYINFMRETLKDNPYVIKSVLTGVLKLTQLGFSPVEFQFMGEFTILHKPFPEFFGFRTDDVNKLSEYYNLTKDEREMLTEWYNGYKLPNSGIVKWYNPYSVLNFILTRRFDTYWVHYGTADFTLKRALSLEMFENAMSILLTKSSYLMNLYRFRFEMKDFENLKHRDPVTATYAALEYLLETGYLALDAVYTKRSCAARIPIKIPNHETYIALKNKMIRYFVQKFKIPESVDYESHLKSIEHELKLFLLNNEHPATGLKNSIEKFLNTISSFTQQPPRPVITQSAIPATDNIVRSILNFVFARNATFEFLGVDDCMLQYQNKAAYVLTRYNATFTQQELQASIQYAIWAFRRKIFVKSIKIIEINITPNKTVQIRGRVIDNALANVTTPSSTPDSFKTFRHTQPTPEEGSTEKK